ncbi:type III secretion protein [Pseudomonas sp. DWRC2-2]|uniref:type III secretion protein n=1 Tax=Pseudomonas sp. DWRC2-2 TaxID=2804567 RepID=UPI003CF7143E
MNALIRSWLNSHEEQLTLFEDNDVVSLKRQETFILFGAQLTSTASDTTTLQRWLRLGAASLNFFQGTLVRNTESGELWLMQTLRDRPSEAEVVACLETLLNQRDTWRATFTRLARTPQHLKPTSLRSLSY